MGRSHSLGRIELAQEAGDAVVPEWEGKKKEEKKKEKNIEKKWNCG